ncbi:mannonate dehydratase, partial [Staphylococcus pasteuri]|uniref:mannonate dehydratase n=1 Tax=Staphylococcus pasteuri TaxID=45972 RepID=UPI00164A0691
LNYFIQKLIPVAEDQHVLIPIHPHHPPSNIFPLPPIITNKQNLQRFINLYHSTTNPLTISSPSLAPHTKNHFLHMLPYFPQKHPLHFVHPPNLKL